MVLLLDRKDPLFLKLTSHDGGPFSFVPFTFCLHTVHVGSQPGEMRKELPVVAKEAQGSWQLFWPCAMAGPWDHQPLPGPREWHPEKFNKPKGTNKHCYFCEHRMYTKIVIFFLCLSTSLASFSVISWSPWSHICVSVTTPIPCLGAGNGKSAGR